MSNRIRSIRKAATSPANIEELAAKARAAREEKCSKHIQQVLATHNCQMTIVVQVGTQLVGIGSVISLPTSILISSK